jgi:exonuclease-1
VRFVVAPYEADAQLAYLAHNGIADAVLTEDSDLLAYRCPLVFVKMDRDGWGEEIALADLPQCRELSFAGWTHELFQMMCAMAGCDFVKALPGIGIKRAHAHIRRTRDFRRAVRALRFDGTAVPPGYESAVQRALWIFRHQRVYCPQRRQTVPLAEPPGGTLVAQAAVPAAAELRDGELDFLGPELPPDVAQAIAEGEAGNGTAAPR